MSKSYARQQARTKRVRLKLKDNLDRPRLHVFRSNRYLYAQIIDDNSGQTLVAATELELKAEAKLTKTQKAESLGKLIAKKAKLKKINRVKFDRGRYQYHGRVKALAEAARAEGLNF